MNKGHIRNLQRAVGKNISSTGMSKYSYILDSSDLTSAWIQLHDELGYPLQMDSRYRRVIVYNKKGLEQQIEKMIINCMEFAEKELVNMIVTDIETEVNNVFQRAGGTIVLGKSGSHKNSATLLFTSALTKGLVKGFFNIIDNITDTEKDR